jgi:Protein of unknown function (DUF2934)
VSKQAVVRVTKRQPRKALVAELADSVVEPGPVKAAGATVIDPSNRRQLVAVEAYLFAERRGFSGGHEVDDWIAAERLVDSWLTRSLNS